MCLDLYVLRQWKCNYGEDTKLNNQIYQRYSPALDGRLIYRLMFVLCLEM